MKKISILLILFICCISQANVKYDKWLIPSYFRGYNVLYERHKTLQDFIDFKNYGGNFFQIGVWGFYDTDSPYSVMQNNIDSTDRLVGYCRQTGLYYALAVRSGPGAYDSFVETQDSSIESRIWNTGNRSEQMLYADMLKFIVKRYASDTLCAGINLVVEPRPKAKVITANNSSMYKSFLESFYDVHMDQVMQYFVDEVRTLDPELPLIVENFGYSTPELFPPYTMNDQYIIYDAHLYMPKEYTSEPNPYTLTYPGTYWNLTTLQQELYNSDFLDTTVLATVKQFQTETGSPVLIGEFGMLQPQNGDYQYVNDVLNICSDNGWHFALWDWRRGDGMNWNIESFVTETKMKSPWRKVLDHLYPPVPAITAPIRSNVHQETNTLPHDYSLYNNFPNPFNPSTNIKFDIPERGNVKISVFDILGRPVKELVNKTEDAGSYIVQFDASSLSSGIYIYKMESISDKTGKQFINIKKMSLVK